ncbi:MAG TPA: sigma-70 family RNA polymerase sigma factor [Phycisphaerae bacterium]|nr:sigma-70 family RNA polymerase sigma factor [Phycisphaerae bacterium]HOJ73688.1 sigma-70 family RNA polymerase sigma factor [Phycisphaerae bacterium]HOM50335.1 sigma-70 family RNA polymerase sigma factor [Phycisphaerae bacterium]HON65949.1 sigma-70 family RNA polymerase sigma factor [Phycisphaerae bacterium]HOQ84962.1 sigma-70 family RNA polymerase sigma factor [Phycisphaerae bacterium]
MPTASITSVNGTRRHRLIWSKPPDCRPVKAPWFTAREWRNLRVMFREPLEYIDHDLFAKPWAESLVFGGPAVLVPGEARFTDNGDESVCGLNTLSLAETPTAAQETLLFQRLNYARMRLARLACQYVQEGLAPEALREMLAWHRRATDIRELLARLSLTLVPAMAKQSRFQNLDFNELISEGNCALLRAIMTFDCARGYRFSTYACRAILKSFARVILRTTRYRNRFPVEFDPDQERCNVLEGRRDDQHAACVQELRIMLAQNRARLTDIEQKVIRERFALNAEEPATPKTLDEIGEMIGVTKERVRQIQNKALRKLRHDMEKNYLAA